jgi:mannose-6-phosphate isomerase-like protein (cupin superfamily)
MSYLSYKEKATIWGKIREYDTISIPSISLYERIFAKKNDAELTVHSHPDAELYVLTRGSAFILTEKEGMSRGLELKEGDVGIILPGKKHSVSLAKGGILDIIRLSSETYTRIISIGEPVKSIEKKLKVPVPLIQQ